MATSNTLPTTPNAPLAESPELGIGATLTSMSGGGLATTLDGIQCAYRYAEIAFSMVATPTDVLVIQGSATKTVRIRRIFLSGAATAAANMPFTIVRRSTAGTLGSAVLTAVAAAQEDINNAAPTAVVSTVGTANYGTVGTSAGIIAAGRLGMPALASGVAFTPFDLDLRLGKSIVLRGTLDFVCVNFGGTAIPSGGVLDFSIELEEDAS
jgi:hypothetical protein